MSCLQTLSGIARDCSKNIGGIDAVWIANFDDVTAVSVDEGVIDAITMATGKTFKKYRMRRGAANMTSTLTVDAASGVSYVATDLVLQFNRMETTKRVEMAALALGELRVLVEDNNGKIWMLGKDDIVLASAGDGQTGAAMGDGNRYTITLHLEEKTFPLEVDADAAGEVVDEE